MGLDAVLDQGLLYARPMVMGGVIPDQIDPLPPQAPAPLGQAADGRLLTQPVAQHRDDSPTRAHDRHRAQPFGGFARRGRLDRCRLAAQEPPQAGERIRPDLPLVHIDRHTVRLARLLHLLQGLGERPLSRWLGLDDALARPLAPEAQPVQIAPSGRGGDGFAKGPFDEGCHDLSRPGAGLTPDLARGPLDSRLQRRQLWRGEPGARLPTKRGVQPGQPVGIEAADSVLHRPPAPAHLLGNMLGWLAAHDSCQGQQSLPQPGMWGRETFLKSRGGCFPLLWG